MQTYPVHVPFTKFQVAGNDLILVDEWDGPAVPDELKPELVRSACNRHFSVGSDGVIFTCRSRKADVKMAFYNPDGSTADTCTNGLGCVGKFAYERGYVTATEVDVETPSGARRAALTIYNDRVEQARVDMGRPRLRRGDAGVSGDPKETFINREVVLGGRALRMTAVGMGNPHAVIFVDDIAAVDVAGLGREIRNHAAVFPRGANVHFVEKKAQNEYIIRSYERGVEDEVLACGSGICASAAAAHAAGEVQPEKLVKFSSRGGELNVRLMMDGDEIERVGLTLPVVEVYHGRLEYDPAAGFEKAAFNFMSKVLRERI